MSTNRFWRPLLAAGLLTAGALAGAAAPAHAVSGVQREVSPPATPSTDGNQTATARCDTGQRVVGGGALVNNDPLRQVFLQRLQPTTTTFIAEAASPITFGGSWSLQAYAICADLGALPQYQIVQDSNDASAQTSQQFAVPCPAPKRIIGTGGAVFSGGRDIGLNEYRADGNLGLARVSGRVAAGGVGGTWGLTGWAICTNPIVPGAEVDASLQPGNTGRQLCFSNKLVHGPGGGGSPFLHSVVPSSDLRRLDVVSTGSIASSVLVHMSCAP